MLEKEKALGQLEIAQYDLMNLLSQTQNETDSKIEELKREIETLEKKARQERNFRTRDELEEKICDSDIVKKLKELAAHNPPQAASVSDMRRLRSLVNELIPSFYGILNPPSRVLREMEYDVCVLVRMHFSPVEISRLMNMSDSYVAKLRQRILQKAFCVEGNPKELDARLLAIN